MNKRVVGWMLAHQQELIAKTAIAPAGDVIEIRPSPSNIAPPIEKTVEQERLHWRPPVGKRRRPR